MAIIIKNIKGLVNVSQGMPPYRKGSDMMNLPILDNAWLVVNDKEIEDFGEMPIPEKYIGYEHIDASGSFVLPAWIDSHTHLVYPASRENEFILKIKGATYEEIAAAGGGIINSAIKLRQMSEDELFFKSVKHLEELILLGTGAIEIKSGYGLNTDSELKMLNVIKRIKDLGIIPVKSSFLGAHAIPPDFKNNKKAYINLIINEMLPEIIKNNLADYIDIFIEKGFFEADDAMEILESAKKYGIKPRLHIDQMTESGGLDIALQYHAISVDHLEQTSINGINKLAKSKTIPVLLPSCSFYLKMKFPDARKMIDNGLGVVIASDYNPGSSPSGNLNFSLSLACINMFMFPEEAINGLTTNAAYALELNNSGAIFKGAQANLIITKPIPSIAYLPYRFAITNIAQVIINGKKMTKIEI